MSDQTHPSEQIEHVNRPYAFEAYNDTWPQEYSGSANTISGTLGDEVVNVEHIGSTSIPGMPSKPQIDILVTVKDLSRIPLYYDAMQEQGYTSRGDYTNEGEEYFTKDTSEGVRTESIHVLPVGHHWAIELIDFRDYLKTHPDELVYYANAKEVARQQFPDDYTNYYKQKLPVVHELMKRAAEWRGRTYTIPEAV